MPETDPIALGLPHRAPFLFVDAITHIERGIEAAGTKCFNGNEPFFAGHFPGEPIVPGVILAEALAQVAGIAAATQPGARLRLSAIRLMKFHRPVRPGESIDLHAVKRGESVGLMSFDVAARVAGTLVADGQVVLGERS